VVTGLPPIASAVLLDSSAAAAAACSGPSAASSSCAFRLLASYVWRAGSPATPGAARRVQGICRGAGRGSGGFRRAIADHDEASPPGQQADEGHRALRVDGVGFPASGRRPGFLGAGVLVEVDEMAARCSSSTSCRPRLGRPPFAPGVIAVPGQGRRANRPGREPGRSPEGQALEVRGGGG